MTEQTSKPGPELTVAIAAFNEHATIMQVLQRAMAVPVTKQIVVVDNCSTDGTRELLADVDDSVEVIYQPRNLGKGTSIRTAITRARGEYFIIQDADHSYDYQMAEYMLVFPKMSNGGLIISDIDNKSSAFMDFSEDKGLKYFTWLERPKNPFYIPGGIGVMKKGDGSL